jgi:hypothetical protein
LSRTSGVRLRATCGSRSIPPLKRLAIPDETDVAEIDLPTLVPGQEWRTFWETGWHAAVNRNADGRHTVRVNFADSRGDPLPAYDSVLDWAALSERAYVEFRPPRAGTPSFGAPSAASGGSAVSVPRRPSRLVSLAGRWGYEPGPVSFLWRHAQIESKPIVLIARG